MDQSIIFLAELGTVCITLKTFTTSQPCMYIYMYMQNLYTSYIWNTVFQVPPEITVATLIIHMPNRTDTP